MNLEQELAGWLERVGPPDERAAEKARRELMRLTKPPGSLGVLEEIVIRLAGISGNSRPRLGARHVVVMCGDHGVVEEGVSAFPQEVTGLMIRNFAQGGAAINVLARQAGAGVVVVDVGSRADELPPSVLDMRVRRGTANMTTGPAMSREEALQAIMTGVNVVDRLVRGGSTAIALGEMGIGNTTPSAALAAVLLNGRSVRDCVGRGTGIDDEGLARKEQAIRRALEANRPDPRDPLDVLAKVGGLEIAGLVGVIVAAAAHRRPVVLDGVISTAAALVAVRLKPSVRPYLMSSHLSQEPAHALMLQELELSPFLHLNMRLGEGTGAVLAFPLIEAATRLLHEMATFSDLGLPDPV